MTEQLLVKIKADTSGLTSKLTQVTKLLGNASSTSEQLGNLLKGAFSNATAPINAVKTAFQGLSSSSQVLVAGIGAIVGSVAMLVAVASKIKSCCEETAELGDEIDKNSKKYGLSASAYQEWAYQFELAGADISTMKSAMKTLNSQMDTAKNSTEGTTEAFQKLGISVEEIQNLSQEEMFNRVVQGLQNVTDATERQTLATDLLGKAGIELGALLSETNAQMEYQERVLYATGSVMSQNAVNSSAMYQDSLSTLKQAFKGVTNTVGEAFLPVLTKIINRITVVMAYINAFVRALFGLSQTSKTATASSGGSSGSGGLSKSLNNVGSSADKASKSVEKLKRQTMGFDELNIMSDNSSSSSGSGLSDLADSYGDIADVSDSVDFGNILSDEQLDKIERFQKKMEELKSWLGPVASILTTLIGAILIVVGVCTINFPMIGIGIGLFGLGLTLGLAEDENGDNNFYKFISLVGDGISGIKEKCKEKLTQLFTAINNWWDGVKEWFREHIKPIFTKEYWEEKWNKIKEAVSTKLDEIKEKLSNKWQNIKEWFTENIKPKFTKDYWKTKFDTMKTALSEKLDELKQKAVAKWNNIKTWFNENIKPKFTKKYWVDKFNTIKQGAKDSMNGVIAAIETAVNNMVKKVNNCGFTIPSWIPVYGGKRIGVTLPTVSIPRLAEGGIATSSTFANIGEAGKEAILPLENNTEWMDMLADRLASRIGTGETRFVAQLNGRTLFEEVVNQNNNIVKTKGASPILV